MSFELSRRSIAITVALALLIALGITALTTDDAPPGPIVTSYVPLVTQTPIRPSVLVADIVGPGSSTRNSVLVMVQGIKDRRLVIWPLVGDGAPLEVDRHITYGPLLPDPPMQRVFYSTERTAMVLDIAARRATIVGELGAGDEVIAAQWSPDGSTLAYVVLSSDHRAAFVTRADGSTVAQEIRRVPRGLILDVGWLPDGRPVAIYVSTGPLGGLETHYEAYDPATGDTALLPLDAEVIQPHTPWRSPDGMQQVYPMATWQEAQYKSGCRQSSLGLADARWLGVTLVGSREARPVAFTVPNVYLDHPTWLLSGQIVMRGIADESCPNSGTGLYIAELGERPLPLAISPSIYLTDASDKLRWGPAYAVSADQSVLAWVENDLDHRASTIYLTPLARARQDEPPQALYHTDAEVGAPPPFYYQDSLVILDFIWLP